MKVSVKDESACRKIMTIEVPAENIAEERAEALKAYVKHATIPGFRKGKAPKAMIAKRYAKEINKDLQERLLPKYYQEASAESELKIVNIVDASEVEITENEPLVFDVTVDVEPEFKLPKYTDIPVKKETFEVTDEQVEEQVEAIRNQQATYEEAEDKAVETGDMAQLTYEATTDGQPLKEAIPEAKGVGGGEGYWVSADDYSFIPGLGDAIVGMSIGDKKEVEVEFPEDFSVKELGGVKATYNIEVTGVRVRTLPEIDEAFLERLGLESAEELRLRINEQLEAQAKQAELNSTHEQIAEYLLKKTKFDIPVSIQQQQTRAAMNDIARQRMMMGETQEQLTEKIEEIKAEAEERASENVKLRYIGLGIAAELELDVNEAEINEEIAKMAIQQQKDVNTLRNEMIQNGSIHSVGEQVRFNKALGYMVENAKIK